MQILFKLNCVILFATSLVLLPTLLAASLWKTHVRNGQAANDVANTMDDYYAELQNQVVYLDDIVDNSHAELKVKHKESYVKPSRYGSSAYQQSVADTSHHTDYASDADYAYDSDPYYYGDKPNCDEDKKKKKKPWDDLSKKSKASIILGSIGLALSKLGLISFSSIATSTDTTTTSTTSTTSTTTPSTTTPTTTTPTTTTPTTTTTTSTTTTTTTSTTTTTTMMPMTCANQVTNTTGDYKTIRTPGEQMEQCVSVTVPAGSKIQITCTSINVSTGTYVTILDLAGTSVVANPPIINTAYTTADNTMIIKSLASSANADQLCCNWITV